MVDAIPVFLGRTYFLSGRWILTSQPCISVIPNCICARISNAPRLPTSADLFRLLSVALDWHHLQYYLIGFRALFPWVVLHFCVFGPHRLFAGRAFLALALWIAANLRVE